MAGYKTHYSSPAEEIARAIERHLPDDTVEDFLDRHGIQWK